MSRFLYLDLKKLNNLTLSTMNKIKLKHFIEEFFLLLQRSLKRFKTPCCFKVFEKQQDTTIAEHKYN